MKGNFFIDPYDNNNKKRIGSFYYKFKVTFNDKNINWLSRTKKDIVPYLNGCLVAFGQSMITNKYISKKEWIVESRGSYINFKIYITTTTFNNPFFFTNIFISYH